MGRKFVEEMRAAGQDQAEVVQVDRLLRGWHGSALLDLPGPSLPYHEEAAKWGALRLFRAACFLSFREIDSAEISRAIPGLPLPDAHLPEAHFSADQTLHYWPDLFRVARANSADDPLVVAMQAMVAMVPLSTPGVADSLPEQSVVFEHPGLCQLLAERAFARHNRALLTHPHLTGWVRRHLGAYSGELAPGLLTQVES